MNTPTHCAVILVNYNNATDTLACLHALGILHTPPAHIVIVDNASRHEDILILREGLTALPHIQGFCICNQQEVTSKLPKPLPKYILIELSDNIGFSCGNNVALRLLLEQTDCTAFWLLNNDTLPQPNALNMLCDRLNAIPQAGLCGSTLVYADDTNTVQCMGGSTLSSYTGHTQFVGEGVSLDTVPSYNIETIEKSLAYITGASLLVCRDVFVKVGLFPEEYFLYYEDAAFCLTARKAGFAFAWASDSVVYHKEGGSSSAKSARSGKAPIRSHFVDYISLRNRVYLMSTFYPWALPIVILSYAGVALNRTLRGQADRLGLILRAAWHGLIGRMGKPSLQA